ncbi:MAG: hypothetical protein C0497_12865 [Gemmatimonas sp.]|nr:hypothetical protein [Gemmatimonas sp.]
MLVATDSNDRIPPQAAGGPFATRLITGKSPDRLRHVGQPFPTAPQLAARLRDTGKRSRAEIQVPTQLLPMESGLVPHEPKTSVERNASERTLRAIDAVGMFLVLLFAALHLWQNRRWLDADTVTYADISDALLRGEWRSAINGYFSPAWAIVIAVARRVGGESAALEAPLVRTMQWIVTAASVVQARRLLTELRRWSTERDDEQLLGAHTIAGATVFWIVALFALVRLSLAMANPDALLTLFSLGASRAVFVIRRTQSTTRALELGAWIGAMYWAKGIALPLGLGFLMATALCTSNTNRVRVVIAAGTVALAVSAPFVMALSLQQGRFDFGDTGRLNISWLTAGASSPIPDPRARGTERLTHPWSRVMQDPPVFSYTTGPSGTYPPWRDPVYWQAGVSARPSLTQVWHVLRVQAASLWNFYLGAIVMGVALAATIVGGLRSRTPRFTVALALPPALTAASYLPILFEPRYFAPVALLALASLMTLSPADGRRWPWILLSGAAATGWALPTLRELLVAAPIALACGLSMRNARLSRRLAAASLVLLIGSTVAGTLRGLPGLRSQHLSGSPHSQNELAMALSDSGVPAGARVATIGVIGPSTDLFWARRARLRIVAEVPRYFEDSFWMAPPAQEARAMSAMSAAGAAYLVARRPPHDEGMDLAWRRLGETGFAVRALPR